MKRQSIAVHAAIALMGSIAAGAFLAVPAFAGSVAIQHEPPDGQLRLGQRVRVDDGTCPAGQVKEVTAARLTPNGIARTRICVKR